MWQTIAGIILRQRLAFAIGLSIFLGICVLLVQPKFSKTNAQLLPESSQEIQDFRDFVNTFGNEGNLISLGFKIDTTAKADYFLAWQRLNQKINNIDGVTQVISITDLQKLVKDTINQKFVLSPLVDSAIHTNQFTNIANTLQQFPFYNNVLYNTNTKALQSVIYIEPAIVNSKKREKVVLTIQALAKEFEQQNRVVTHLSGMPVVRTLNTLQVKSESTQFILLSLAVTCLIFFLFFRSVRATAIATLVVVCAVIISFASLTVFNFEVTILTALVPPLLIVIGIPNCIFLINKYQQEYSKSKQKVLSLYRTIVKVGNPALLTNCTTAFGFFTFVFTDSSTLREFGIVASINILGVFLLSFLIIPILYSYFSPPKTRHLKHLKKNWLQSVLDGMKNVVLHHRKKVYLTTAVLFLLSCFGMTLMKTSGNMLDDMAKEGDMVTDINFFDQEFGGILPLEIMIDTKQSKRATSLSTIKQIDSLSQYIDSLQVSAQPISIARLVKFAKQAYYNNDAAFYSLPSRQEQNFILSYIKNSNSNANLLNNYIDSASQKARITVLLKNQDSEQLEQSINDIQRKTKHFFPENNYQTYTTGAAYLFMRGTKYLTKNLLLSLSLAIVMIAIFMSFMFRSVQMIFVALIPNLLPLLLTAGAMGFFGVGLKPSTILVFSIAFGIAVDDTIHYLARYRQQLKLNHGNIKFSVLSAIDETGTSMFYTSVVLFFGFCSFTLSNFQGIVALGGLVSITLIVAMVANLILLPSLLLSYEKWTNKAFIEPEVDLFDDVHSDIDLESLQLPEDKD